MFSGNPPQTSEELLFRMQQDWIELQTFIEELRMTLYSVHYEAPARPKEGMLRFADGVRWNPTNQGAGWHQYVGGVWNKL